MSPPDTSVDQMIGRLASRSHGVVTRVVLLDAGVSAHEIRRRVRSGALLREYAGVYRVGHRAPSVEARYLAAVLACGEEAFLSGAAAAFLFGILKGKPPQPEVTGRKVKRIPGVKTHRSRRIEATVWKGIPVTTVARTLVDLAATLSFDGLSRACHEAEVRFGARPEQVEAVLRPNAKGAHNLRRIIHGEAPITLSRLEKRFLRLLEAANLPLPRTNKPAGAHRVDCRWPDRRLTVELDSYTYHRSRYAWEQDRKRDREARARGDEHRRYTWGDVFEDPAAVLGELEPLLRASRRSAAIPG
jgi:very-short-patch-repair endonuclease